MFVGKATPELRNWRCTTGFTPERDPTSAGNVGRASSTARVCGSTSAHMLEDASGQPDSSVDRSKRPGWKSNSWSIDAFLVVNCVWRYYSKLRFFPDLLPSMPPTMPPTYSRDGYCVWKYVLQSQCGLPRIIWKLNLLSFLYSCFVLMFLCLLFSSSPSVQFECLCILHAKY